MTFYLKGEALPKKLNKYIPFFLWRKGQKCSEMWHNKLMSNFVVFALSFLSRGSIWLLWPLRIHRDIRSGPNYLPPISAPSPPCLSFFLCGFSKQCQVKKKVLEEVPDCSGGWDALCAQQGKADDTHGYTPALIWGELPINLHILPTPVASASTGGGEANPANSFYNMDIVC